MSNQPSFAVVHTAFHIADKCGLPEADSCYKAILRGDLLPSQALITFNRKQQLSHGAPNVQACFFLIPRSPFLYSQIFQFKYHMVIFSKQRTLKRCCPRMILNSDSQDLEFLSLSATDSSFPTSGVGLGGGVSFFINTQNRKVLTPFTLLSQLELNAFYEPHIFKTQNLV